MSDKCPECGVEGDPLYLFTDQCGHTEHRTGFDVEADAEFCYDSPIGLYRCSSYNGCDDWNPNAEADDGE